MSESKTPRTDAKTNTVQMPISTNEWVTVSVVSSDFAKQLELENAELSRQLLEEYERTEPLKIAERNQLLSEVVEYERQIKELKDNADI